MQSSSSFSESRHGRPRPSLRLAVRPGPSESLPWPSPSFDMVNGDNVSVEADPDRPSTQIRSSSDGSFPPTPLTATYKPVSLPSTNGLEASTSLKLPGVSDLLAHTPPDSQQKRTVALPSVQSREDAMEEDAPYHTGYSPVKSQLPQSTSKTGLFRGETSEWSHDNVGFTRVEPRAALPRPSIGRHSTLPVSKDDFRNMPSSSQVQGLGLDLGEATPRLGEDGNWSMMTPIAHQLPGLPGAPNLSSAQSGRFANVEQTSPIKPALRDWNTNLFFERRQFVPRPFAIRSSTDTPSSAAMERERTVEIEGGLPLANKTWGLALSVDEGRTFRRGNVSYRQDGTIIEASTSRVTQDAGPPTPKPASSDAVKATIMTSASKTRLAASPMPMSASKRAHGSTGLTPHIHKTRLTPTFVSSSGKTKASKASDGTSTEAESPSLKMKSKQRSEQLREHAEFIATRGHLPSDLPASSSSPTSPVRDDEFMVQPQVHSRTAPPSVTPRDKKVLGSRNVDCNAQSLDTVSPWGVFGINTSHDAWQPLGPPTLSKALGKLEGKSEKAAGGMDGMAKKARKGPSFTEVPLSRSKPHGRYSGEDKENDVFGSSTAGRSGKRTAAMSPPSPSRATLFGQRRLVNIR